LYFSLALIVGDNLGLHSILGFSESFMANFPCRFCKTSKADCNTQTTQNNNSLRNMTNYSEDLIINNLALTGIKEPCIWNNVINFHVTNNFSVDLMHDCLEGVCSYDLSEILKSFILNTFH